MDRDTLNPLMEYLYMLSLAKHSSKLPGIVAALNGGPTAKVAPEEGEALAREHSCPFISVRPASSASVPSPHLELIRRAWRDCIHRPLSTSLLSNPLVFFFVPVLRTVMLLELLI